MSQTVYVNGEFVAADAASVSVFDRGFLFADAVYEVTTVLAGELIDNSAHLARLGRSLAALGIPWPEPAERIEAIQRELVRRNGLGEGLVYLQISRGAAERNFALPPEPQPTLVLFTQQARLLDDPRSERGIAVITVPDQRWARRDIKTVGLLAPSLAKQAALDAGADDAWLVQDGYVTEGTSNNAYIVTADGTIVSRNLSHDILAGVTRAAVLKLCAERGLNVDERPFSVAEAQAAREAFITSASTFVLPVVAVDGRQIGDGRPGPVAAELRALYIDAMRPAEA